MLSRSFRGIYFPSYCFRRACHKLKEFTRMEEGSEPRCRSNPIIKQLKSELLYSLFTPELNVLTELFKQHNYEFRIVGGTVRDILMDKPPADLDFATNATPTEMKTLFEKNSIRMLNTRGEKHGTVTVRINDKTNFEITTLRIDKQTDGRHAEVQFTNDWKLDALRRDLTINSMFLDLEGKVYDYFYGYDDLQKRRIAFVGNPDIRIRQDYLRILRYFRFYGRIATHPNNHDKAAIIAIKENMPGLEGISGERIWSEWSKILSGNYVKELSLKMFECGIAKYVGLPEDLDLNNFETVYDAAKKNNIVLQPISLLAVTLKNEDELVMLHNRLKLSAYERDLAFFIIRYWDQKPPEDLVKFYTRTLVHWKGNIIHARRFIVELLRCKQLLNAAEEMEKVKIPSFPVNGHFLKQCLINGRLCGVVIKILKDIWLDNNFEISKDELLKEVPRIVSEIKNKDFK